MVVKIRGYKGVLQTMQLLDQDRKIYRIQLVVGQDIIVLNNVKTEEIEIIKEEK